MVDTREPVLHPIPILSLRPTQMTVGMREVEEKRRHWRAQESNNKRAESLGQRMIPVVRGPNQHHYVVDHHHPARALHDEGVKDVLVTVPRRNSPARLRNGSSLRSAIDFGRSRNPRRSPLAS